MKANGQSAGAAGPEADVARSQAENLLGDWRALLRQVGSPEWSPYSNIPFWTANVDSRPGLNQFLEDYLNQLLVPCELPAIAEACGHARRGEWRELLAQDLTLAEAIRCAPFAEPSRQVGRVQLSRLRPLRDERTVQRYLGAVESGQAHGWHTMVYGVTLAIYSLPLRQGLLHYARETLSILATEAGQCKGFTAMEVAEILRGLLARLPEAIEAALQRVEPVSRVSTGDDNGG